MIRSYLPALVFLGLGALLGLIFTTVNSFLGRYLGGKNTSRSQGDPYECGLPSDVKQNFRTFALVETIVFIVLLLIAYVYVWRRGALEWR